MFLRARVLCLSVVPHGENSVSIAYKYEHWDLFRTDFRDKGAILDNDYVSGRSGSCFNLRLGWLGEQRAYV